MRTALPLLLLALCLTALAPARAARADDAPPPAAAGAAIGRDLLSADESVRAAAITRLRDRLARGGDLEPFLAAMADGARQWADRRERLVEVWLHQAVDGGVEEREEAVRLLTALGADAIRRLARELRHARGLEDPPAAKSGAPAPSGPVAAPAQPEPPVGTPRIYDVRDLFERGMNAFEIRNLLQKTPDAVEVKPLQGGLYLVTAEDEGHVALRVRLEDLRTSLQSLVAGRAKEEDKEKRGADAQPEAPEEEAPLPQAAAAPPPQAAPAADPDDAAPAEPAVATAEPTASAAGSGRAWQVQPAIYHVPREVLHARPASVPTDPAQGDLPRGLALDRTEVRVGTSAEAAAWVTALQHLPDANQAEWALGVPTLRVGQAATWFSGTQHHYAKALEQTRGGAYRVLMDTVPDGLGLELHASLVGGTLEVDLVASRTEVGLPIPSVKVQPSPDAPPVALEQPEWSTTRTRAHFAVPATGGGAFVSLGGLGHGDDDHIVIVLRIEPPGPRR